MTTRENKKLTQRFFTDVLVDGETELIDKLVSDNFTEHESPFGQETPKTGRAAVKEMVDTFRTGFPDLKVKVNQLVAEGDLVTAYTTWTGTHSGTFMGIPATNKKVDFTCIDMVKFEDGEATEHWGLTDNLTLLTQIGAIDPPEM